MFTPYSEENSMLMEQYKKANILIRHHTTKNRRAYVYFSGNGLYVNNDEEDFQHKIILNDRYEWQNLSAKSKPEKEIFVRDIWLSWYAKGVSEKYPTIDSIVEFLKQECEGYQITLVGNSAGGYMAVNCGIRMAEMIERVYTFCGQFSLINHNDHVKTNPLLIKYRDIDSFEVFRRLSGIQFPIYYFFSGGVPHDCEQAAFVKETPAVRVFQFESARHGITLNNFDYPRLLSLSNQYMDNLFVKHKNKIFTADSFSRIMYGKGMLYFQKSAANVRRKLRRLGVK